MVNDYVITFIPILFLIAIWFIIRKIFKSVSNKINNAEDYR